MAKDGVTWEACTSNTVRAFLWGETMKMLFTRSRCLLAIVALATMAATSLALMAHASSPSPGPGNAAGTRATGTNYAAASDAQCTFRSGPTCQSTDPTVTISTYSTGNTSDCTFLWNIDWGDGNSSLNLTLVDPPSGWDLLAQHTYSVPGVYTITLTGETAAGNCTTTDGVVTFTLLRAQPSPSPQVHWSRISGRPGTLVTLTGNGWVPGATVRIHLPSKGFFYGSTSWRVGSHGDWKQNFAVGDARPGSYKVSLGEASGHLQVTGTFKMLAPSGIVERFIKWLNACVDGQLSQIDPGCKQAAYDLAGLGLDPASIFSCSEELPNVFGVAACLGEKGAYAIYKIWHWWQTHHKPGP